MKKRMKMICDHKTIPCEKNLHLYSFMTFKTNYCCHYAAGAILQWSHFLFTKNKLNPNKVEKKLPRAFGQPEI